MRILWFTWKDKQNPEAGGAEVVSHELARRLVADGHEVILLVRSFPGGNQEEMIDGYRVIRNGGFQSVYFKAYKYYQKNLKNWPDLVIEEINTVPFFTKFYTEERKILFFHQLCREIWFYEMGRSFKALVGFLAEPAYLFLLRKQKVITVSSSTQKDLMRFGFGEDKIKIISEGIEIEVAKDLEQIKKFEKPTLLSLGAIRPMKRTNHIVKAFELTKKKMPDLQLIIAGNSKSVFGAKVKKMAKQSKHQDSIQFLGKVSKEKKIELMQKSHLIAVTSVKEGWGLIVTEANSQGTPAVVYNVDGLRDSVQNNQTGWITEKNTPTSLSKKIQEALSSNETYEKIRLNAWSWSKEINFEKSYREFLEIIKE